MIIIFGISALIILIYLMYPLWLMMIPESDKGPGESPGEIDEVSLIYLSYNGIAYLEDKINFLLKELSVFQNFEIIIIDDNSTDGSKEWLNTFPERENIRITLKDDHKGIPNSMNMGVGKARFKHIIFCDQRQKLSGKILHRLVEPLKYDNLGAVSACISELDKNQHCSRIRRFENFIKLKESRNGNLIGVYGPLYAIKKECFSPIPEYIILDDLYLSLKILKSKQIKILGDCQIMDEEIAELYDYGRAKRYIYGFLQLIREPGLITHLDAKQVTMLFWHKYLRLAIPVFLFLSHIGIGILGAYRINYLFLFIVILIPALVSFVPGRMNLHFWFKNIFRINLFYFVAILDVLVFRAFIRRAPRNYYKEKFEIR